MQQSTFFLYFSIHTLAPTSRQEEVVVPEEAVVEAAVAAAEEQPALKLAADTTVPRLAAREE